MGFNSDYCAESESAGSKMRSRSAAAPSLPPLLALTRFLGFGFVGPAYRGNIITSEGDRLRVIAKIALDVEEKAALRREATVYRELHKLTSLPGSGTPSFVGLYDDVDDGVLVLVTTDVGDSLRSYDQVNKK
jgi:hypothetical protein